MNRVLCVVALIATASAAGAGQKKRSNPPPVYIPTPPPIIIRPVVPEEKYGAWTVGPMGTGYGSFTGNGSGSVFGVFCKSGCVAYLNAQTQCEEKAIYPALVNSSAGAFSVNLTCTIVDKRYLMAMQLSKTLISSFEIGGEIGIAFPLESGRFQVTRFSLTGAMKAAERTADLADEGKEERPSEKQLGDYRL